MFAYLITMHGKNTNSSNVQVRMLGTDNQTRFYSLNNKYDIQEEKNMAGTAVCYTEETDKYDISCGVYKCFLLSKLVGFFHIFSFSCSYVLYAS